MATAAQLAPRAFGRTAGPPRPAVLVGIVIAGLAASVCAVLLAVTSDHIPEPGVHSALQVWGLLGFILAGVVAWWRRPESRFGLLMIAAGGAWFLSALSSSNDALPFTIGIAFDLLPAVLFLHVFLAFPSGRLERWYERALVAAGYFSALALQLVGSSSRRDRRRRTRCSSSSSSSSARSASEASSCSSFAGGRPDVRCAARWRCSSTPSRSLSR
jgi:hypothetical protein